MQNNNKNERAEYQIKIATAADIDVLKHIEDEVFSDAWSCDSLSSLFENARNVTLIAWQNDTAVGYITASHVQGEAEIARLAVVNQARQQGIGSALIVALLQELDALGIVKLSLEVRVSNNAGFAIYHKFGFAARGRRPRYYEDGEDALVMVKGELG